MRGLVNFGAWREANLFRSAAGMTRGNHFHRHTTELFAMLEGSVRITLQRIADDRLFGETETVIAKAGDVFLIEPNVYHTFEILEETAWINLLDVKLDATEPDIRRPQGNS